MNEKSYPYGYNIVVVSLVSPMSWGLKDCLLKVNSRDHALSLIRNTRVHSDKDNQRQ